MFSIFSVIYLSLISSYLVLFTLLLILPCLCILPCLSLVFLYSRGFVILASLGQ